MNKANDSVLGIDPGSNGGLALIGACGVVKHLIKMPSTPMDLLSEIRNFKEMGARLAVLEKVGGLPGNGASAMFNFGRGYGHIEMALYAAGIPFVTVTPQKWQKYYQLGKSAEYTKTEWKNRLREAAQRLHPDVKVTLWAADALLIGRYGLSVE